MPDRPDEGPQGLLWKEKPGTIWEKEVPIARWPGTKRRESPLPRSVARILTAIGWHNVVGGEIARIGWRGNRAKDWQRATDQAVNLGQGGKSVRVGDGGWTQDLPRNLHMATYVVRG